MANNSETENYSETENFSYAEAFCKLLGIAGGVFFAYSFVIPQIVLDDVSTYKSYNIYTQECGIFLERATNAGTTEVAEEELVKAVNWLKANYSNQAFEYKSLQSNLDYLKKQPEDSLLPIVIKDSIKYSNNTIKIEKSKNIDAVSDISNNLTNFLINILLIVFIILLLLLMVIKIAVNY